MKSTTLFGITLLSVMVISRDPRLEITSDTSLTWKLEGNSLEMLIRRKRLGKLWFCPKSEMSSKNCYRIIRKTPQNKFTLESCQLLNSQVSNCHQASDSNLKITHQNLGETSYEIKFLYHLTHETLNLYQQGIPSPEFEWAFSTENPLKKTSKFFSLLPKKEKKRILSTAFGDGQFMLHEHGHLILWTVVADTLIVVGKYWKSFSRWFDVHTWAFVLVLILNQICVNAAPKSEEHEERILEIYSNAPQLSKNERILASALESVELHKVTAALTILPFVIITLTGLVLRFAIALDKRYKCIHFVNSIDLTVQRIFHTILGIFIWISARICCLTGVKLHEKKYGATLYILLIVETIVAFSLFIVFEVSYRFQRKKWKVNLAVKPTKTGKIYEEILQKLRNKGKKNLLNFF